MDIIINKVSAGVAIIIFIGFIIYKRRKGKAIILSDIVIAIIAGGMLPLACSFALYPFFPHLIGSIETMSLQITLTGLVLILSILKPSLRRSWIVLRMEGNEVSNCFHM